METFRLVEFFNKLIEQVGVHPSNSSDGFPRFQAGLDIERRYLVANKIDLVEDRQVDEEVGQRVRLSSAEQLPLTCRP